MVLYAVLCGADYQHYCALMPPVEAQKHYSTGVGWPDDKNTELRLRDGQFIIWHAHRFDGGVRFHRQGYVASS